MDINGLTITPQSNGFLASSDEKSLFFPNAELLNVGCKNCVWKLHGQCPYGLVDEESYPKDVDKASLEESEDFGYGNLNLVCPEMINFLSSLADKNSALDEVWEKFHVYKARLQESVDYADFVRLSDKIKKIEKSIKSDNLSEEAKISLEKLEMDRNAAKLWWIKLNQHVIFSMQKINDRAIKKSDAPRLPGIQSSGTINFNIKNEIKQLGEK